MCCYGELRKKLIKGTKQTFKPDGATPGDDKLHKQFKEHLQELVESGTVTCKKAQRNIKVTFTQKNQALRPEKASAAHPGRSPLRRGHGTDKADKQGGGAGDASSHVGGRARKATSSESSSKSDEDSGVADNHGGAGSGRGSSSSSGSGHSHAASGSTKRQNRGSDSAKVSQSTAAKQVLGVGQDEAAIK